MYVVMNVINCLKDLSFDHAELCSYFCDGYYIACHESIAELS